MSVSVSVLVHSSENGHVIRHHSHLNLNTNFDLDFDFDLDLATDLDGSFHHSSRVIHKAETRKAFDDKAYTLPQMASSFPLHRNTRYAN